MPYPRATWAGQPVERTVGPLAEPPRLVRIDHPRRAGVERLREQWCHAERDHVVPGLRIPRSGDQHDSAESPGW